MRTDEDIFNALLARARPLVYGSLPLGVLAAMTGVLLARGVNTYVEGRSLRLMIVQSIVILLLAVFVRLTQSRFAARAARQMALEFRVRLIKRALALSLRRYAELDAPTPRRAAFEGSRIVLQSVRMLDGLSPQIAQQVAGVGFVAFMAPELLPLLLLTLTVVGLAWVWVFRQTPAEERSRKTHDIALSHAFESLLHGLDSLTSTQRALLVEREIAPRVARIGAERVATRRAVSMALVGAELTLVFAAAALIIAGPMFFDADPLLSVVAGFLALFIRVGVLAETPQIARALEAIPEMSACLGRLERMATEEAKLDAAPARPAALKSGLTMEGVTVKGEALDGFSLKPVNLAIQVGEIIFLVGCNGSGKTTLLRLIAGLCAVDAGRMTIDGSSIPHQASMRDGLELCLRTRSRPNCQAVA